MMFSNVTVLLVEIFIDFPLKYFPYRFFTIDLISMECLLTGSNDLSRHLAWIFSFILFHPFQRGLMGIESRWGRIFDEAKIFQISFCSVVSSSQQQFCKLFYNFIFPSHRIGELNSRLCRVGRNLMLCFLPPIMYLEGSNCRFHRSTGWLKSSYFAI